MSAPFPSLTSIWHNDTYPAIDPSRPENDVKGKKVIVSGGGRGIGTEIVSSFATAGASRIDIIGRTASSLDSTKATIAANQSGTQVVPHVGNIADEKRINEIAQEIDGWDILVLNAGYLSDKGKLLDVDLSDWWQAFEVNVKGVAVALKALLPTRSPQATVIVVATAAVSLPADLIAGSSSYAVSKLAAIKLTEVVAAEYPDVYAVSVHPGVIATDMYTKSKMDDLPVDSIKLPADFIVWLTSPEARFLRGKFAWCNWDVDELKAMADKIGEGKDILTANISGWPFSP